MKLRTAVLAACLALACPAFVPVSAVAQDSDTEKAIEKYRQMMKEDPWSNPGLLDADRGEALWKTPRGPNKVSLETCDLGKGPGKVDGAFAELPRFFADAGKVMDLETRLLWCQEKIQGFQHADLIKNPHPGGGQPVKDTGAIATWVANKSSGMKFSAKLDKPQEKEMVALGEALFNRRSGPFDFACTTCHAEAGKRIRFVGHDGMFQISFSVAADAMTRIQPATAANAKQLKLDAFAVPYAHAIAGTPGRESFDRSSRTYQLTYRSSAVPGAWADWEKRPPGYRKVVTHWVTSAKRPETRAKRLGILIESCAKGEKIPGYDIGRKKE